jgi:hypothetical protein
MFARGLVHMATEVDLNRWREAGKEIGRKIGVIQERDRIIRLLADSFDWNNDVTVNRDELIALIRGEKE